MYLQNSSHVTQRSQAEGLTRPSPGQGPTEEGRRPGITDREISAACRAAIILCLRSWGRLWQTFSLQFFGGLENPGRCPGLRCFSLSGWVEQRPHAETD